METKKGKKVAKVWEDIWKKAKVGEWDKLSETIYQILYKGTVGTKGKLMLEAGSGTGRISFRLKEGERGNVILLDVSKTAIKISKEFFKERGQVGFFILGSIFKIPIRDNSIDIVWNAGVLEHFSDYERKLALKEMTRICRKNGLIITLNPYSRAVFYRIGKWFAEKRNRWIYGYEKPIKSMTKYAVENCVWIAEYSADLNTSIGFLSSIPYLRYFIPILRKLFKKLPTYVSNHFGYLLISIGIKVR